MSAFDVFRLKLDDCGGQLRWRRVTSPRVSVQHVDLRARSASCEDSSDDEIQLRADRVFDLASGPVGSVDVLETSATEWTIVEAFDHVFVDGRSLELLHRAVSDLYLNPAEPAFPGDGYHALLRDQRPDPRTETVRYWSQVFDGFERAIPGVVQEHQGSDEWRTSLNPRRVARLSRVTGQFRGTTASAFLAAHGHAIARHIGTGDVATQIAIRCRDERSFDTFGQLTSLVPVRLTHDWSQALSAHVSAVTRATLAVGDHLDMDLESLERAGAPVGLGHAGANAFVMQEPQTQTIDLPGVTTTPVSLRSSDQGGGLVTMVRRRSDGSVDLSVRAPRDSQFAGMLTSIGETIDTTLGAMETHPDTRLASDLLLPQAARDLIVRVSTPSRPYPFSYLTDEIVTNLIALGPRIVVDVDLSCTASRLLLRVQGFERALRKLGVGPGNAVSVGDLSVFERIAAFVAVLRVGAVYVPFEASESLAARERKEHVTQVAARVTAAGAVRLRDPHLLRHNELGPKSAAYVIFTSGSSGAPKAVVISRESLSNLVQGEASRFGITSNSRMLLVAPPIVDPWICHVTAALLFRATIVPVDAMSDGPLADQLRERRVTHAFLPTVLLRSLESSDLPELRMIATAGDHCRAEDLEMLRGKRIFNIYGPTEATVTATIAELVAPTDPVPIGRPIRGLGARVVIDRAAGAPPGVEGELALSGAGIALRYDGDETLTERSFGDDPFNPGCRWYFTGDRARLALDGSFILGGRVDRQVKIRGIRVEPESLEATARATGLCFDARVKVVAAPSSADKRLVLFVEGCTDVEPLIESLKAQLPQHSWPHNVVAVRGLPRSTAGKVADELLPGAFDELVRTGRVRADTGPTGILSRMWTNVLGTPPSSDDNFFSSGGDSLTVLRLVKESRANGLSLSPSDVYNNPRYRDLDELSGSQGHRAERGTNGTTSRTFALGPAQQWFFAMNPEDPRWWHQRHVLAFEQLPDLERLEAAISRLATITPVLRAAVDVRAGQFTVRERTHIPIEILDAGDPDSALCAAVGRVSRAINHLDGTMLGALVVRGNCGDGALVLIAHHLAVDTWSWSVIEQRILDLLDDEKAASHGIDQGFGLFSTMIARQRDAGAFDLDAPAWANVLSRGETSHLNARPLCMNRIVRPLGSLRSSLCGSDAAPVHFLLASIGHALLELFGPGVTVIDLERNGRNSVAGLDVSDSIGWFALHHPVAVRHEVLSNASVRQVRAHLDAVPESGISYGALRWSGRADIGERVGRVAVDVADLRAPPPEMTNPLLLRLLTLPVPTNRGNKLPYEAAINFRSTSDGVTAVMEFDPGRISAAQATSMLDSVSAALGGGPLAEQGEGVRDFAAAFDSPVPASTMQRLMIHHAGRLPAVYRPRQLIAVGPVADPSTLLDSLETFLGSFDALRRRFATEDGTLFQVWLPESSRISIRRADGGTQEANRWLTSPDGVDGSEVGRGGSTVDAVAFLDAENVLLALEIHHAVMDGRSNRTLLRELDRYVSTYLEGGEIRWMPLPSVHRRAVQKHVGAELAAASSVYTSSVAEAPVPSIPRRSSNPFISAAVEISRGSIDRLQGWAGRNSVDLRSSFSSLVAVALREATGEEFMHVVANGRDADVPETAEAVGMFWYFQRISTSQGEYSILAKRFYAASAKSLKEVRAEASDWLKWHPQGASLNFTKQDEGSDLKVISVVGSRDLFHFDTQARVDVHRDGSAGVSFFTTSGKMILGRMLKEFSRALKALENAPVIE